MPKDDRVDRLLRSIRKAAGNYDWQAARNRSDELVEALREQSIRRPDVFFSELQKASAEFDKPRVAELSEQLIDSVRNGKMRLTDEQALEILGHLRSKRYFDSLERVADALIFNGVQHPKARRQYAQALIEQGRFTAAQRALEDLISELPGHSDEYKEASGLLGRLHKQIFVETAGYRTKQRNDYIKKAVDAYRTVYRSDKEALWHGINLVALLCRAKKERLNISRLPDPQRIARQILKKVEENKCAKVWDLATAAEACLGLQDYSEALDWVIRYSKDQRADAFEIASTLRQFKEVWQLRVDKKPGAKILRVLNAALLEREGGKLELARNDEDEEGLRKLAGDKSFEKVLGEDGYTSFTWYFTGIERSTGVAIIKDRFEQGVGTGFVVRGNDLKPGLGDDFVLLTNEHVISNLATGRSADALSPDKARISFEIRGTEHQVKEVIFCSSATDLDVTIVRLSTPVADIKPYPVSKHLPAAGGKQRVYVIGHPKGGRLSLSIHDNTLLDHKDTLLHYRAPTEGGSSGSPVFNSEWDLIALHHAGGFKVQKLHDDGTYPANEGIWIQSIVRRMNQ